MSIKIKTDMKKNHKNSIFSYLIILLVVISVSASGQVVKTPLKFIEDQTSYLLDCVDSAVLLPASWDKYSKSGKYKLVTPRSLESNGALRLVPSSDWCSGFFPGNLWFIYELTGEEKWKKEAGNFTQKIEKEKLNATTHDMGFKMLCSFGNGYRLTKDENYKKILIESAYTLTKRFNPKTGLILSWDHSTDKWTNPVIIDNMMNLELLFYAFRHTRDSLFYRIAVSHADNTMKNHFRSDYSCFHVVDYNPLTGEVIKKTTHQGLNDSSSWSRGQGWALYGYVMMYRETKDLKYLKFAEKIASFILNHRNLPADKIPYFDFDAPSGKSTPRDASAGSLIASALYEISTYPTSKAAYYRTMADIILNSLNKAYLSDYKANKGFLLTQSTGSYPQNSEVNVPLIYADYYYLEALVRRNSIEKKGTTDFN
jgi:unsaturated chondroitin disaccharide hydrolase